MLALKAKTTQPELGHLKQAVETATQNLLSARLAIEDQSKRLGAIEAALREDRNSDALAAQQVEAESALQALRIAVRNHQNALRTAEQDLDLARTMPARKTSATQLR